MPLYIVRALDYTDEQALERRMQVRATHFEYLNSFLEQGKAIFAGAMLDDNGKMIGSTVVYNMSKAELNNYFENEPYIIGKVWEKIEINEFKLGPAFQKKYFSEIVL